MSIGTVTQPIEFPCPMCRRAMSSKQALAGHMFAHRGPEPCPECGQHFKPGISMARHRENTHGVVSQRRQQQLQQRAKRTPASAVAFPDTEWKSDDIFQATLNILWPNGVVPVHAVLPLIQWREDTKQFLEKIR